MCLINEGNMYLSPSQQAVLAIKSKKSRLTPEALRCFPNLTIKSCNKLVFKTNISIVSMLIPCLKKTFVDVFQILDEQEMVLYFDGYSDNAVTCLDQFLHQGIIQFSWTDNESCKQNCDEIKQLFSCLKISVPEDFWAFDSLLERTKPVVKMTECDTNSYDVTTEIINVPAQPQPKSKRKKRTTLPKQPVIYECTYCEKKFVKYVKYEAHIISHKKKDASAIWDCRLCKLILKDFEEYTEHMNNHENRADQYQCTECPKTFLSYGYLQRHLETHQRQEQPGMCDICGKVFSNQSKAQTHKNLTHTNEVSKCTICDSTFKNKHRLRKHINRSHTKTIYCEYCSKEFNNTTNLKQHVNSVHVANDERPHRCHICGRGFGHLMHLKEHINVHNNVKPYKCKLCDHASSSLANRNKHERTVHKYNRTKEKQLLKQKSDAFENVSSSACNKIENKTEAEAVVIAAAVAASQQHIEEEQQQKQQLNETLVPSSSLSPLPSMNLGQIPSWPPMAKYAKLKEKESDEEHVQIQTVPLMNMGQLAWQAQTFMQ